LALTSEKCSIFSCMEIHSILRMILIANFK
jgi:hypothetical protein